MCRGWLCRYLGSTGSASGAAVVVFAAYGTNYVQGLGGTRSGSVFILASAPPGLI